MVGWIGWHLVRSGCDLLAFLASGLFNAIINKQVLDFNQSLKNKSLYIINSPLFLTVVSFSLLVLIIIIKIIHSFSVMVQVLSVIFYILLLL